jgi:hypothetical protein
MVKPKELDMNYIQASYIYDKFFLERFTPEIKKKHEECTCDDFFGNMDKYNKFDFK